jgi:hypothetical protein
MLCDWGEAAWIERAFVAGRLGGRNEIAVRLDEVSKVESCGNVAFSAWTGTGWDHVGLAEGERRGR